MSLMLIPRPFESWRRGFQGYELFLRIFVSASRHCHEGLKSGFRFTLHPVNENNNAERAHMRRSALLVICRMTRARSFALYHPFTVTQTRRLPYHCRFNCNFQRERKLPTRIRVWTLRERNDASSPELKAHYHSLHFRMPFHAINVY